MHLGKQRNVGLSSNWSGDSKKELSMMEVTSIPNESVIRRDENLANDHAARKSSSLYDNVVRQFNKAADLMRLDSNIGKILEKTTNEIVVHFPVKKATRFSKQGGLNYFLTFLTIRAV
jgi:hypothetical protein